MLPWWHTWLGPIVALEQVIKRLWEAMRGILYGNWRGGKDFMVRTTFAPAALLPSNLSRNPVRPPHRLGVAHRLLWWQKITLTDLCKNMLCVWKGWYEGIFLSQCQEIVYIRSPCTGTQMTKIPLNDCKLTLTQKDALCLKIVHGGVQFYWRFEISRHCGEIALVTEIKLTNYCKKVPRVWKLNISLVWETSVFHSMPRDRGVFCFIGTLIKPKTTIDGECILFVSRLVFVFIVQQCTELCWSPPLPHSGVFQ